MRNYPGGWNCPGRVSSGGPVATLRGGLTLRGGGVFAADFNSPGPHYYSDLEIKEDTHKNCTECWEIGLLRL